MALQQAGERAKGATLYVTLEPCCHHGRTPPCTKAIVEAGISEVHIAMIDPNPLVSGKGLAKLEEVGIKVNVHNDNDRAREINEGYFKYIATGLPFIIAKFALSLDGKIATRSGDSRWISSEESRKYVHNMRHVVDAVMVGANTVLVDDPQLSARGGSGRGGKGKRQPLRVIVDGKGRIPLNAKIFKEPGVTLVAVASPFNSDLATQLKEAGAEIAEMPAKQSEIDMKELLILLGKRQITSVLVEGGNKLFGSLFDQHLIDKVMAFISPVIIGGSEALSAVGGGGVNVMSEAHKLDRVKVITFGDDTLISGYLNGR
jgi:diaminohydroxyphosphoribosylaminopyrimidine deaminase/5-amino-6-(5-phosphoribosylamino)uracil reductase